MDFVKFNCPSHPALQALASKINSEAEIAKVPPCALAAIVMRETGGRNILQEGMPPGPGCGVGLTQITAGVDWSDASHPKFDGYDLLDEEQNLYVAGAYFLFPAINECLGLRQSRGAGSMKLPILFYAFVAYNAGLGAVTGAVNNGTDPDAYTTDRYGTGTLAWYSNFVAESHNQEAAAPAAANTDKA